MKLSGEQVQQLHEALRQVFPRRASLRQFVRMALDQNLEDIAAEGNLSDDTFNLIEWVEAHGRLEEFVQKAYQAKPRNLALRRFATQHFSLPEPTVQDTI